MGARGKPNKAGAKSRKKRGVTTPGVSKSAMSAEPKAPSHKGARSKAIIARGLPANDAYECTLTYVQEDHWTQATGAAIHQVYNANNIFDPDQTGVGHAPYLSKELFGLYHRVLVVGVSYDVRFINDDTSVTAMVASQFSTAQLTAGTSPVTMEEFPYSKFRIVGVKQSGTATTRVRDSVTIKRLGGLKTLTSSNNDFTHTSTGGPAQTYFLTFSLQAVDKASTVNVYAHSKIHYKCIFFDRVTTTPS